MKHEHNVQRAIQREFSDWRRWWSRAVVMLAAACAGLTVVAFTWLCDQAFSEFSSLYARFWWAPLLWTPALTASIVWVTRRFVPGASGSGIPQVMAALEPSLSRQHLGLFVSLRLSFAKIWLTAAGLLAGLSLGREGPSVQVAAGVMLAARRLLPKRTSVSEHGLLVAGGAAGIAAAFNTPLGGVMFAIEELSRTPEQRSSGLLVAGIVLAGLMAVSIHGNQTYFGVIRVPEVGAAVLLPGLLTAVVSGIAGGLFARLLRLSLDSRARDRFSGWRRERPVLFAMGCGLAVALIGIVDHGSTFGAGYESTKSMLAGEQSTPAIYVLLKFIATWFTYWSGVPAGIFAPSLAIGGALGNDIAALTHYAQAPTLIALGMTGFLAAATQAPMTAFIIVMEMVDGHALVLSLMASALIAASVSRLLCVPLYGSLAQQQLGRVPPASPVEPAQPLNSPPTVDRTKGGAAEAPGR
jgi:H+/Cl- antiporter ClcA